MTSAAMRNFFAAHDAVVCVRLDNAQGSAPREVGAQMFVARGAVLGTIGGGEMEYRSIDAARALLRNGGKATRLELPLGPQIGQCCGGRVQIGLKVMDRRTCIAKADACEAIETAYPHVLVFGAGHVGRALAAALTTMPVRVAIVDSREAELEQASAGADLRLAAVPEMHVRTAPPHSAFVIATHDHGLDFLLTAEALARGDAAYVGLIGSSTKRATFKSWLSQDHPEVDISTLTCPIGAAGLGDKRPEVIAAHTVSELMSALPGRP